MIIRYLDPRGFFRCNYFGGQPSQPSLRDREARGRHRILGRAFISTLTLHPKP